MELDLFKNKIPINQKNFYGRISKFYYHMHETYRYFDEEILEKSVRSGELIINGFFVNYGKDEIFQKYYDRYLEKCKFDNNTLFSYRSIRNKDINYLPLFYLHDILKEHFTLKIDYKLSSENKSIERYTHECYYSIYIQGLNIGIVNSQINEQTFQGLLLHNTDLYIINEIDDKGFNIFILQSSDNFKNTLLTYLSKESEKLDSLSSSIYVG